MNSRRGGGAEAAAAAAHACHHVFIIRPYSEVRARRMLHLSHNPTLSFSHCVLVLFVCSLCSLYMLLYGLFRAPSFPSSFSFPLPQHIIKAVGSPWNGRGGATFRRGGDGRERSVRVGRLVRRGRGAQRRPFLHQQTISGEGRSRRDLLEIHSRERRRGWPWRAPWRARGGGAEGRAGRWGGGGGRSTHRLA